MRTTKLKTAALVFLAAGVAGAGIVATAHQTPATQGANARKDTEEAAEPAGRAASDKVTVLRVPNHGIQPQAMTDGTGVVHLIYFAGEPGGGDIFYVRSKDGDHFSHPLRVNSQPGSAIATGNVRGAHLALGKNGRAHVAWMGSHQAEPRAPGNASPMLYTRLNEAGTAFEPQRNVIQSAVGLDGGGSVAADGSGNVYIVWHASEPGTKGEGNRCVWVARSTDDGQTFSPEKRANQEATGACGCCGMRAFADGAGTIHVLYRSATERVHRDMYALTSSNKGVDFRTEKLQPWTLGTCPMSTAAIGGNAGTIAEAWETDGQVYFARIDKTGERSAPVAAPGEGKGRKHPAVAASAEGETLLVWTEGMGWSRGGSLAWQLFDKAGKPTEAKGHARGVPPWSLVAVVARPDGRFTVIY